MANHVWLIGLMGSGKSAIGAALAEQRGLPFYDVDERVEAGYGRDITDVFFMEGEEAFRAMETAEVRAVAEEPDGVVATGGGVIIDQTNVRTMKDHGTRGRPGDGGAADPRRRQPPAAVRRHSGRPG